jgi:hypothetical protein
MKSGQKSNSEIPGLSIMLLTLFLVSGGVSCIAFVLHFPIHIALLSLLLLFYPAPCQYYGIIVGAFTIFSGIKLAFSGQSFPVTIFLPFLIFNNTFSSFCIGWGLMVASLQKKSMLGWILGIANLIAGLLEIYQFKHFMQITAPGVWGALLSGILTVSLGSSMVEVLCRRKSRTSGN